MVYSSSRDLGVLVIPEVLPEGPAAEAGLEPGIFRVAAKTSMDTAGSVNLIGPNTTSAVASSMRRMHTVVLLNISSPTLTPR